MTMGPDTASSQTEPSPLTTRQERSAFDRARDFLLGYPDGKPAPASPTIDTAEAPIPTMPPEPDDTSDASEPGKPPRP